MGIKEQLVSKLCPNHKRTVSWYTYALYGDTDTGNNRTTELLDRIFDLMFDHQASRVEYYTTIIHSVIKGTGQASKPSKGPMTHLQERVCETTPRDWEDDNGLHFKFGPYWERERPISDKVSDLMSDKDHETIIQEAYNDFRLTFDDATIPLPSSIKNFLKKIYYMMRDLRQRPAFKALLRQSIHNNDQLFKKAWSALLYLTRIFYAAVTLVDFASKFETIKLQDVPRSVAFELENSNFRNPVGVLVSLGYPFLLPGWRRFFQSPKTIDEFMTLSRPRTVHAEIQLINHIECKRPSGKIFPYIGCSKKCCFFCEQFCKVHGTFETRGTHEELFKLWTLPKTIPKQSIDILRQFLNHLRSILAKLLKMRSPPRQRNSLAQSSAALSTAQAAQREKPVYSSLPQEMVYVYLSLSFM